MPLEIGTTIDTGIDRPAGAEPARVLGPDGTEYLDVEHADYGTSIRVRFEPDRPGLWTVQWRANGTVIESYPLMVVPRDPGARRRQRTGPATVEAGSAATRVD